MKAGSRLMCGTSAARRPSGSTGRTTTSRLMFSCMLLTRRISKRLEECLEELQTILEEDELSGIPLLFFANKQDLITALEPEEIVEELQLDVIEDRDWSIFG
mmetsp:Transcript_22750/g.26128  ORF Transcript_22750/g.26128 Transcript_22750/m.26128 type:complete len:102 (+) Transcript_22750:226-531(+)